MSEGNAAPSLRLLQEADIKYKVVLIRVDHNTVKKGKIKDASRIDASLGTIFNIVSRGGKPILMTHIGRPRNKKTGKIDCVADRSVSPIVAYLEREKIADKDRGSRV
ncbi:MAG: phosphoglycerate kinase [Deltaproteobacteria bacterium]|nr:phosphoglycerate kinase [Deltaproteobacteria bacterium]